MHRKTSRTHQPTDASGPVLAWCTGTRCTALHRIAGGDDHAEQIRSTVRNTPGSVLITSACLGRCELACVAAIARRDGSSGRIGPMAWFTGLENGDRFDALRRWVADGGPRHLQHPGKAVPSALAEAACGVSAPPRIPRR